MDTSKKIIVDGYRLNLAYANELVKGVNAEHFAYSPGPGLENHPAWTLGHLVVASALTAEYLQGDYNVPSDWDELFRRTGPGDPIRPEEDSSKYPICADLLLALDEQHNYVEHLLLEASDTFLAEEKKWRFAPYMSSRLGVVTFMCLMHESMHLSQLAAWRRAMNLDSAFGKL